MRFAVGVLLFVCTILTFHRGTRVPTTAERLILSLFATLNALAGVGSITNTDQRMQIAISVLLCVWFVVSLELLLRTVEHGGRWRMRIGDNAYGNALILFAVMTIFMVLQFSVVM